MSKGALMERCGMLLADNTNQDGNTGKGQAKGVVKCE